LGALLVGLKGGVDEPGADPKTTTYRITSEAKNKQALSNVSGRVYAVPVQAVA
jgi:hypothetical protein